MRVVSESVLAAILARLSGVPRIVAGGNYATPWQLLKVVDAVLPEYRLFALNAQAGCPDRVGVTLESAFVGPGMRGSPRLSYLPCRLSLVPNLLTGPVPPDVVLVQTSPPAGGTVSLGTEVNILPAAIEAARARGGLVVAQLNRHVPFTYGDSVLAARDIDLAIEADVPLPEHRHATAGEIYQAIGERVARLVPEAATLQLGIGAVPDAVLGELRRRRGLAIWSEMFSDGVLALEQAGALTADTPITASFAFGTAELYAWLDCCPRVRMLRTEKTNDPGLIACQPGMTSVNGALQVDLFAQANAARVHGSIYSGFGGQTDFVVGALHAHQGRAIIALPSWHPKADKSTVVARLTGPVTSFQHSFFVSEQGTATIWGNDASTQAAQIIGSVAHPSARDELREHARDLGFKVTPAAS